MGIASTPGDLPLFFTPFFGRETECALLLQHLHDPACRLVTIVGIGGVGKTRLAIEAAAALTPSSTPDTPFPDGVFLVPLAALLPGKALDDQLATTIATALGLPLAGPDPAQLQLRHYLREKTLLLLLDNVEHLMDGTPFFADLLQFAPALKLLITSREGTRLRGERIIELDGLACPVAVDAPAALEAYAAVSFFLLLARIQESNRFDSPDELHAISRICGLVGGLPLGIELAANWTRFLSCAEIANELERSRDVLAGGIADVPERQQSLRAVFVSSWRMLTSEEQAALRPLAIFSGGFTRDAALAVANVSLPHLASLINKSLIRRVGNNKQVTRFILPEPLRPYVLAELEQAGELDAAADRHSAWYLGQLAVATAALRGPEQPVALAALGQEIAQIRTAWRRAVAAVDIERISQGMNGLFHVYDMRSWFGEGADLFGLARAALEPTATVDPAMALTWARLLAREAWFVFHSGRQQSARVMLDQSLTMLRAGDAPLAELVWTGNYLAAVCSYLGEYDLTIALCHESMALAAQAELTYERVVALSVLCQTTYDQGAYAAARGWGEQSLVLEQRIGSPWSIAFSLTNLGKVAAAQGEYSTARDLIARSLQIRRELGDLRGAALCRNRLGDLALALADPVEAVEQYTAALTMFRTIGNPWGIAATLLQLGLFATRSGSVAAAARLLHEALELSLNTGAVPQITAIIAAFADLLRRAEPAAAQHDWLARDATDDLSGYQVKAARLLAWSAGSAPMAITLEAAIAATREAAQAPADHAATPPPPAVPTYPGGLTVREVEVLRLVAQGMTDGQVADRLVLSRRTVQSHLASIYSKLAINSRSAATRFAVEHGLA